MKNEECVCVPDADNIPVYKHPVAGKMEDE